MQTLEKKITNKWEKESEKKNINYNKEISNNISSQGTILSFQMLRKKKTFLWKFTFGFPFSNKIWTMFSCPSWAAI